MLTGTLNSFSADSLNANSTGTAYHLRQENLRSLIVLQIDFAIQWSNTMKITVRCCVGLWLHLFPMIVSLEWNAKAKMKMKFAMIVKYTIRTSVIEHTLFKMVHDNCDRTLIDHYVPRQCAAIYYNESSQKGRCEHINIYWCYSPAIIKTTEKNNKNYITSSHNTKNKNKNFNRNYVWVDA